MTQENSTGKGDGWGFFPWALLSAWWLQGDHGLPFHLGGIDHPIWKTIYFWPATPNPNYISLMVVFASVAAGFQSVNGKPRRLGVALAGLVVAIAAVLLTATSLPGATRIAVSDSLAAGVTGLTAAALLADGTLTFVWQNLLTKGHDYTGRFFPLAGCIICLASLGLWSASLYRDWVAHAGSPLTDVLCFALGAGGLLLAGRKRD